MPPVSYPLDTTGIAAPNLIVGEIHTLTEINDLTYRIIIPTFAPFYLNNLLVEHVSPSNVVTTLVTDVDYTICLVYNSASRALGKMLYGGITINTELLNGTIKIRYQTLGGEWTADPQYVLEKLAEYVYNPRITIWDVVTDKPNQFPPSPHDNNIDTTYGYQELLDKVDEVITSIIANNDNPTSLLTHLLDVNNVHGVTKTQVGLGNVANIGIAIDQEVIDKEAIDKLVTLRQILTLDLLDQTALITLINDHIANVADPHEVTKAQVGLSDVVNLPLATPDQLNNLTLANAYITLAQAIPLINKIVAKAIQDNNPSAESLFISGSN